MSQPTPGWVKPLLLMLGLLITAANFLVFTNWSWFERGTTADTRNGAYSLENRDERLRQSVFLVKSADCASQRDNYGTAFAVAPGYLVTAAQVVSQSHQCPSGLRVVDSRGASQSAQLAGYSEETGLALVEIVGSQAPPIPLASSQAFENSSQVIGVYTVGYPLVNDTPREDQASFSDIGVLTYDKNLHRFGSAGVSINSGNSGGPAVLETERKVLGVAVTIRPTGGTEGISYIIPSDDLRRFFRDTTGQELP